MLEEAAKYASIDQEKKEQVNLKNYAETLCEEGEKQIADLSERTTSSEETIQIENCKNTLENLRSARMGEDYDNIKVLVEQLKTELQDLQKISLEKTDTDTSLADDF